MDIFNEMQKLYKITDYLTMKDVGNEVVMASGKPKPTKYGQLHSMYESRLCTSQPTQIHTAELIQPCNAYRLKYHQCKLHSILGTYMYLSKSST